jgi:hypothetical protein
VINKAESSRNDSTIEKAVDLCLEMGYDATRQILVSTKQFDGSV